MSVQENPTAPEKNLAASPEANGRDQPSGLGPETASHLPDGSGDPFEDAVGDPTLEAEPDVGGDFEFDGDSTAGSEQTWITPTGFTQGNAADPDDLMTQILLANTLEQSGEIDQAIQIYQQILTQDESGTYGQIAQKALENLGVNLPLGLPPSEPVATVSAPSQPESAQVQQQGSTPSPLLRWLYDLPIARKQLVFLLVFEILTLALVGAGAFLINQSLRNQLLNQAKSELAVTKNTYINQLDLLGAGFQSQANNPAVIATSQRYTQPRTISALELGEVKQALQGIALDQQLEYVTMVDENREIVMDAHTDRLRETFDPEGLVTEVLAFPRQVRATAIVNRADLEASNPPSLPPDLGEQALIRYVVTPVIDPETRGVTGALIAGDLVDGDQSLVESTLETFGVQFEDTSLQVDGGYSGIYMHQAGQFTPVTTANQQRRGLPQPDVALPDNPLTQALLNNAIRDPKQLPVTERLLVGDRFYTVAAQALPSKLIENDLGETIEVPTAEPVAVLIRGTPETALNDLLLQTLIRLGIVAAAVAALSAGLAVILSRSITNPLRHLGQVAHVFSQGDRGIRAEVEAKDEVGQLAQTFNTMADSIVVTEAALENQARRRQAEAEQQQQLKEVLQRGVINLLLEIEGAQRGDLTVQAPVTNDEVGSIADAFNATIRSLRQLVAQVKTVANRVNQLAQTSEVSVRQLSRDSLKQASELAQASAVVAENATSIERVSKSTQEATQIAQEGAEKARAGDRAMDQTVQSMDKIRTAAGDTSKQVKRLAESSQEISQIVAIIASIADRTNLLAFNASLEAARAGEHGQGFRQIADEVRRLALQVNESAQDIEHLVTDIQQETAEVIRGMEINTTEVVIGTQLVNQTKQTLQELVTISQRINHYLEGVSRDTSAQTGASQQVSETIADVAAIAQNTSAEAHGIVTSLQELVLEVRALQDSVARFQLETISSQSEDRAEIASTPDSATDATESADSATHEPRGDLAKV